MRHRSLLLVLPLLFSCGGSVPPPEPPTPPPATTDAAPPDAAPSPAADLVPLPAGVPDSPAGRQLAWTLAVINDRRGQITPAEVEAHFHPTFLANVPADKLIAVLGQLSTQLAPLTLTAVDAGPDAGKLVARTTSAAGAFRILVSVDATTGTMTGLLFQPDLAAGPAPKSFAEVVAAVPALAPRASLLVAAVDKGTCAPLQQVAARDSLAIGSTFKLWILLGLVDQIVAGKLSWEQALTIRDDWKSLPSGTMQDEAAGATFPIRRFAELMISISDNTATDHLLYTVGRERVEAALKASKHHAPAKNVPFLSTREFFLFKLSLPTNDVDAYLKQNAKQKRAFLDKTLAGQKPELEKATSWQGPRRIDELEWFASAEDLCRLMATLKARADAKPAAAPLLEVLSMNPGLPIAKESFPFIGFKGGSEPGVMNLTWLVRRDDDRWFVVVLTVNDPDKDVDQPKALALAQGVFTLLAKEGR